MTITILLVKKTLFLLVKKTQFFIKTFCYTFCFWKDLLMVLKNLEITFEFMNAPTNAHMNAPPLSSCFETICFSKKIVALFVLFVVYYNLNLKDVNKHIHDQGTKKDNLTKKRLQRTILDFYCIYYFMIIMDWCMIIIIMMSC